MTATYGQTLEGLTDDGVALRAPVFNEHEVRAAAGITMACGTIAFVYAAFDKQFLPIQVVSTFFFIEFLIRVTVGLHRSPTGIVARWLMRRQEPLWVSAVPKRFAWMLGLVMSASMAVITNVGIRGLLPKTICLICITLMWLESALGLCLGCETHAFLVRRGWARDDENFEVCAHGACRLPETVAPLPQVVRTGSDVMDKALGTG